MLQGSGVGLFRRLSPSLLLYNLLDDPLYSFSHGMLYALLQLLGIQFDFRFLPDDFFHESFQYRRYGRQFLRHCLCDFFGHLRRGRHLFSHRSFFGLLGGTPIFLKYLDQLAGGLSITKNDSDFPPRVQFGSAQALASDKYLFMVANNSANVQSLRRLVQLQLIALAAPSPHHLHSFLSLVPPLHTTQ